MFSHISIASELFSSRLPRSESLPNNAHVNFASARQVQKTKQIPILILIQKSLFPLLPPYTPSISFTLFLRISFARAVLPSQGRRIEFPFRIEEIYFQRTGATAAGTTRKRDREKGRIEVKKESTNRKKRQLGREDSVVSVRLTLNKSQPTKLIDHVTYGEGLISLKRTHVHMQDRELYIYICAPTRRSCPS